MNPPIQFARTPLPWNLEQHMKDLEREIVMDALQAHNCNRTKAGRAMGLSLSQIRYRMQKLGIEIGVPENVGAHDISSVDNVLTAPAFCHFQTRNTCF